MDLKLVAPNSLVIEALKLANGNHTQFTFSYHKGGSVYTKPADSGPAFQPTILIDSEGNEWSASEVEWHSLQLAVSDSSKPLR